MRPPLSAPVRSAFLRRGSGLAWVLAGWLSLTGLALAQAQPQTQGTEPSRAGGAPATTPAQPDSSMLGPIRLRNAPPAAARTQDPVQRILSSERDLPLPGAFEQFVQRLAAPAFVRRFGAELSAPGEALLDAESNPLVPPDYVLKAGDEVLVTLWGSVDADLRVVVDRSGRITIPRVGPVLLAGVRYADLNTVISQRVSQVFRNFQISTSLAQLRAKRIYVTGFVVRPGAYSVGGLATVSQALMSAGGPSAAGSLRQVEVRRGKERVATFDLYDFLLNGDRSADAILQPDDVVHVGAVGQQVALIGSVNRAAIFELKPNETVGDVLRMAGGFTAVADRSRLSLERLSDRSTVRIAELAMPAAASSKLSDGDVLRAFSAVDVALPVQRQNKRVRVEGEVQKPGEYVLPPESTLQDAIKAAGGLTAAAYVFGTDFSRESVRATQQENYERALRDLETDLARNVSTQRTDSNPNEATAVAARDASNRRLLNALRAVRPTGRVVLQLTPESTDLPVLALEDGDRLMIPPRSTSVGVFGSVFNGGNYLYSDGRQVGDYLRLAGGPTRGADARSIFVVRANGTVVSGRQQGGRFGWSGDLDGVAALPGDTVFVPEEMDKSTFTQSAKDWTQILYQLGVGLAGLKTAF
jgi:protein involved in polysaccharide export with SLBB domain